MKLDWVKIWDEYDKWYSDLAAIVHCKSCKHSHHNAPEWEDQMKKIEKLVEKHLKQKTKG